MPGSKSIQASRAGPQGDADRETGSGGGRIPAIPRHQKLNTCMYTHRKQGQTQGISSLRTRITTITYAGPLCTKQNFNNAIFTNSCNNLNLLPKDLKRSNIYGVRIQRERTSFEVEKKILIIYCRIQISCIIFYLIPILN